MIAIVFNGESRTVPEGTSIADLLHEAGIPQKFCAVELNKEILPKDQYEGYEVNMGDMIEVVTLVGGG
jgi:thiamine biosynthesis protein ThiS